MTGRERERTPLADRAACGKRYGVQVARRGGLLLLIAAAVIAVGAVLALLL